MGTTTIAVYLCNLTTGTVLSTIAVKNPQSVYGDDVISRINAIGKNGDNLSHLQQLVVNSMEWGLQKLLRSAQDDSIALSRMVVVGNPTMIHILAGVSPKSIGMAPYAPVFYEARVFQSSQLGFSLGEYSIQTLPQVSGFIGGDTLAAALAADLDSQPDGTLLIDLGTNGELLLKSNGILYATSCATGPAFEGAELSCGMQATPGAINAVEINDDKEVVRLSVIGGPDSGAVEPSGICGPGVISALAQFYARGIIQASGRFQSGEQQYILSHDGNPGKASKVFISQKDIRSVQLGKAALMTGIEFLLNEAGLEQPEKILVAGAFGNHLNKDDMISLGMIPALDKDRIEMIGNSAGAGSVMALCDDYYMQKAVQETKKIKTIDLARNTQFQKRFVENLGFPVKK